MYSGGTLFIDTLSFDSYALFMDSILTFTIQVALCIGIGVDMNAYTNNQVWGKKQNKVLSSIYYSTVFS